MRELLQDLMGLFFFRIVFFYKLVSELLLIVVSFNPLLCFATFHLLFKELGRIFDHMLGSCVELVCVQCKGHFLLKYNAA